MTDELRAALAKLTSTVIDEPGVVGTAIGLSGGRPCLKVLVSGEGATPKVPSSVDGHRVVVERSGPIERH